MYSASKSLRDLPAIFTLDTTLKSLLVDNLPSDREEEAFNLIQDSAARGDNVGLDEFPSLNDLTDLLVSSAAFSLRDVGSDDLLGLIIVQPSNYSRSLAPYMATIYIITATDISHKSHWRDLARLAERLVVRLGLRYGACVTSVFCACVDRLLALTEEGFQVTACINESGTLAGSKNLTPTYVLYKDLRLTPQPKYPFSEMFQYIDTVLTKFSHSSAYPSTTFAPIDHVLNDGTEVVIRSMRVDETSLISRMFGRGFGFDEWPTDRYFERMVLDRSYNFLVVEKLTGTAFAAMIMSNSAYARGASAKLLDGYCAIHPDYVGRGFAKELAEVVYRLGALLGYRAIHTDAMVNNMAAVATLLSDGYAMTGVIPKSIYILDEGWVDTALFYKRLPDTTSKNDITTLGQNTHAQSKL